ncbi:MAG: Cro/C1-type DNA-binding domain [Acidobacteriota bacterium]|nr:Cro/C1-type DNA-binding domain [Acidobacteriota bacterium]
MKEYICYATLRGMIEVKIREIAEARGITTAYQLQKALDVAPSVAARLWRGEITKIGLDTLDNLCRVLKSRPDKVLKYTPESDE